MSYCFYIDYLDMEICLEPFEVAIWDAYSKKLITYATFRKRAREILIEKGVPRGLWISVMMYILGLYEEGRYYISEEELEIPEEEIEEEIEEEEEYIEEEEETLPIEIVEVEFEWYGRTEYCKKAGHHIVTECVVTGWFECLKDYFEINQNYIRDRLAEHLWSGYVAFLSEDYVFVVEETSEGFSRFDVTNTKSATEINRLNGTIINVHFYRGNNCGDTVKKVSYYDSVLEDKISAEFENFMDWLESECGIHV